MEMSWSYDWIIANMMEQYFNKQIHESIQSNLEKEIAFKVLHTVSMCLNANSIVFLIGCLEWLSLAYNGWNRCRSLSSEKLSQKHDFSLEKINGKFPAVPSIAIRPVDIRRIPQYFGVRHLECFRKCWRNFAFKWATHRQMHYVKKWRAEKANHFQSGN